MTIMQQAQSVDEFASQEADGGLHPEQYLRILWKRKFYLVIPFLVILAAGVSIAMLWPPTFSSEARILVVSQQIPVELVRPTVTAGARERIEVIQQRVLTRENLLGIVDKYQLFPDQRQRLSRTELVDLMKEDIKVTPIETLQRGRNETVIAVTIGYSARRSDLATQVANELVTLFLNEDARSRSSRAMETTRFLTREVQKLETDLASVDAKIAQLRLQQQQSNNPTSDTPHTPLSQLAMLKLELAQKSSTFSQSHPEIRRLKGQIAALEKLFVPTEPTTQGDPQGSVQLDALQQQRKALQKNIEDTAQKLAAARTGENLERDQFSERLEVLEQAVVPQKPVKPNRPRLIAMTFFFAAMAGIAAVFAAESFDRTLRGSHDLLAIVGSSVVVIPYISTNAELTRNKSKLVMSIAIPIIVVCAALVAIHFLVRPLDELWTILITRLFPSWPF